MEKSTGTIIRLTKLTESSLIVHWCTCDAGIIKTVAKGARRPKSGFAGALDLFVEAELVWQPSRSSELHKLVEVDVVTHREGLRRSYGQTLAATYFCQLAEALVEPQVPVDDYYDLLKRGLDHLCSQADLVALRHYEREIARLAGLYEKGKDPGYTLREHCGGLPRSRETCLEVLSERAKRI